MQLLIAINKNKGLVRLCETNNIDTAIRTIKSRMKIPLTDIYQAQSHSMTTIEKIHDILREHRYVSGNKWSKQYLLSSYRVRTVISLLGLKMITFQDNEYDILVCAQCGNDIEAEYLNVGNIFNLIKIINSNHYCSDECESYRNNQSVTYCVMCNAKMIGNYVTCSAKCENRYRAQKKANEDTRKPREKRAWEI
jgi:hypothetical protein